MSGESGFKIEDYQDGKEPITDSKPLSIWQDGTGAYSLMRKLVHRVVHIGLLIALAGTVAMFMGNPQASAITITGAGMVTAGLGMKGVQAFAEAQSGAL